MGIPSVVSNFLFTDFCQHGVVSVVGVRVGVRVRVRVRARVRVRVRERGRVGEGGPSMVHLGAREPAGLLKLPGAWLGLGLGLGLG